MTIDERIQALTESVELLASLHKDHESRMDARLDRMAHEMNTGFALLGGTLQVFGGSLQKIALAIETLTTIVADHEARLKQLEGGAK